MLGLAQKNYEQSVVSINKEMFRENTLQPMEDNSCYKTLAAAGVAIASLGRIARGEVDYTPFTTKEMSIFDRVTHSADAILSVKEQPLRLITQAKRLTAPVIVELHRSDPEHQGQSLDNLHLSIQMGRVAGLIATAEKAKQAYVATGIPETMIHTIRNGVDLDKFKPSPERRSYLRHRLNIGEDDPVVCFIARFDPMKDIPLFLDSACHYLNKEPTARVIMCGAGMTADNPDMQAVLHKSFYSSPELLDRITLLGIQSNMEHIYPAADIIASTSRYGETYPLCLMEGLACDAIPVATPVGDSADIVGQGRGILTPKRDPRVIANAWRQAYTHRHDYLAAIQATRHQFCHKKMLDNYHKTIHACIS
jgi:glycosyltransferase involved in cell wall biosynthesis